MKPQNILIGAGSVVKVDSLKRAYFVCVCVFLYIYEDIYPPQSYFEFLVILYAANLYFINLLHGQCLPGGDSSVNVYFVYSMHILLNTSSKKLDHIFLAFIPAL